MADRPEPDAGAAGGFVAPMLPTAGPVPTGTGWAFEIKFDGVRACCAVRAGELRLFSRNANDITNSYPEISAVAAGLETGLVLDGELVALDERGRPDFGLLQHRMGVTRPTAELQERVPVQYVVFDVLARTGTALRDLPYVARRQALAGLDLERPGWRVPANFVDTPGELVLAAVAQQGLEGVVAKRLTSTYQPGRSRSWIKTALRQSAEVVIAGWHPATGARLVLGSLVMAAYDADGQLVHVGDVGSGFTDAARRALLERLAPLARDTPAVSGSLVQGWHGRSPGRGQGRGPIQWVEPQLVGEIECRNFGPAGAYRHPSWRGLRPDRDPREVRRPVRDP